MDVFGRDSLVRFALDQGVFLQWVNHMPSGFVQVSVGFTELVGGLLYCSSVWRCFRVVVHLANGLYY